ncbi:MAG: tryptophan synthase subunit alpha [Bacteroidota bacterium]
MNRLDTLFQEKKANILNIYFTAGYPHLHDTTTLLTLLEETGVDIVEVGMPFSDPLADGETIQGSSQKALENGMTLSVLFEQLQDIRQKISIPIILMGYLNPVLQYGMEAFCKQCKAVGVDAVILPDLPLEVYETMYAPLFQQYGLANIFLITPQTSEKRIRAIDKLSKGFIYMVSSASTTGAKEGFGEEQEAYFQRIQAMNLNNPCLIGFGIANQASFLKACQYAAGAIIGSAFIKATGQEVPLEEAVKQFVAQVRPQSQLTS